MFPVFPFSAYLPVAVISKISQNVVMNGKEIEANVYHRNIREIVASRPFKIQIPVDSENIH